METAKAWLSGQMLMYPEHYTNVSQVQFEEVDLKGNHMSKHSSTHKAFTDHHTLVENLFLLVLFF